MLHPFSPLLFFGFCLQCVLTNNPLCSFPWTLTIVYWQNKWLIPPSNEARFLPPFSIYKNLSSSEERRSLCPCQRFTGKLSWTHNRCLKRSAKINVFCIWVVIISRWKQTLGNTRARRKKLGHGANKDALTADSFKQRVISFVFYENIIWGCLGVYYSY